jgi:hypothetical protein
MFGIEIDLKHSSDNVRIDPVMWLGLQLNFSYIQPIFEDLNKSSSNLQSRGKFSLTKSYHQNIRSIAFLIHSLFIYDRRSAHYCDIPS